MGFHGQEYWSGLLIAFPGKLPHPKIEPTSSALAGRFIITEPPVKSKCLCFLVAQMAKHLPTMRETWVQSLGREDLLEKEMATHFQYPTVFLPGKIPWIEDPGRLQSMGLQRVGHD